ncbi:alpha/beta fold hydrolase [Natrinema caseinilyticum]|uniref:alpha/beta fold hydrolase n=1 Tax=Natrinema caseinilyticum TaxID=2961570 RepID=UPI0020C4157A|nr:alpha/beta hydrolase [Natrinema caseinilyticum]
MTNYDCVTVNDIDLYYQDVGTGKPVVFLHGFGGNHLSWFRQMPAFADRYRCLVPDQRMFGRSVDAQDGPGVASHVADLTAFLDHLEIDTVAVVGHSMGGWPAASFATQHPERTAALVLSGTPGGLLPPDEHRDLIEKAADTLPTVDPLTSELSFLSDAIDALNTDRPAEFAAVRPPLDDLPIDPNSLVTAGIPTFLIAGEADHFMPRSAVEAVTERLEDVDSAIVNGAGHSSNFERPTAFNRLVGDFLEDHLTA